MRSFLLILFNFFLVSISCLATGITAVRTGDWSSPDTWNCHCVPGNKSDIEIPESIEVILTQSVVLSGLPKITITIGGVLNIKDASLYADADDQIAITETGAIHGVSAHPSIIRLGIVEIPVNNQVHVIGQHFIAAGRLPARLIGFQAAFDDGEICIRWSSRNGFDYDVYTLERSADGISFEKINQQRGINSTPAEFVNCLFYDTQPVEGRAYYRLTASRKNQPDATTTIMFEGRGRSKNRRS